MKRVQPKTAKRESKYWDLYSVLQNGVKQAAEVSSLNELMHVEDEAFYERILLDSMSMSGGGSSDTADNRGGADTDNTGGIDDSTDGIEANSTDGTEANSTGGDGTTDPDDGTPKSGEDDSEDVGSNPDDNVSSVANKVYCSKAGEYGDQSGVAVEVEFGYELETTNGGKDLLSVVEEMTSNVMLENFFPAECSESENIEVQAALRSGALIGNIEGVSARPFDAVLADVDCKTPPQAGNKCEVYKGGYSLFFSSESTDAFKDAKKDLSLELISSKKDAIEDSHPDIISMNMVNLDDYNKGNNPVGLNVSSSDSGDDGTNVGIIVGPIIAGVVILALGMYALSRKKKRDSQEETLLEEGNGENFADE